MSRRLYELTRLAVADVENILTNTLSEFGNRQLEFYENLIDKAACMVGDEPMRPSSKAREDLGPAVRSFHIEIAAGRRGAASHVLYYIPRTGEETEAGVTVLRVLWEGMEPGRLIDVAREEEVRGKK